MEKRGAMTDSKWREFELNFERTLFIPVNLPASFYWLNSKMPQEGGIGDARWHVRALLLSYNKSQAFALHHLPVTVPTRSTRVLTANTQYNQKGQSLSVNYIHTSTSY